MKAILVLVAALAFALAPFLSPEFGGFDPERYPVPQRNPPVQPAGWAFGIWGLIYLGLLVHAAFGVFKHRADPAWDRGRPALALSLAIGAIWLPVALVSPVSATLLIWVMLIGVLVSLSRSKGAAPVWAARWPVALYAGWLSAASFVSIGLLLAGYGWTGELPAAIIALVLAAGFVAWFVWNLATWPYGAAAAWGFIGIAAANAGASSLVAGAAAGAAPFILALTAWRTWSLRGEG